MNKSIYRFRSIDKVLSTKDLEGQTKGFDELRKQEIYFSSLSELNDPMEGHKEIYWRGDKNVWKNLLSHYVTCLLDIYASVSISGDLLRKLSNQDIPIFGRNGQYPYEQDFAKVRDIFFFHETVSKGLNLISQRESPIRKNELLNYLLTFHFWAISSIKAVFDHQNLSPQEPILINSDPSEFLFEENHFCEAEQIEKEHKDKAFKIIDEMHYEAVQNNAKLTLIYQYKNRDKIGHNQKFLINFPENYLKRIEDLLYPNYKIACFSKSYENASMWSHYADKHEGICFQYKEKINLFGQLHELDEVKYQKDFPEIDFFKFVKTLRTSRIYPIIEGWDNVGEDQLRSKLQKEIDEKNATEYRTKGRELINTKTSDWAYENELRLNVYSEIGETIGPIEYDFESLEGIIFGINTKIEHKIKIIEIIEQKCQKIGRKDFKFYQANYFKDSGKIKKIEMDVFDLLSLIKSS